MMNFTFLWIPGTLVLPKQHRDSHIIVRLQVHLFDEQSVYFTEANMEAIAETTRYANLTAWFKLNQEDKNA